MRLCVYSGRKTSKQDGRATLVERELPSSKVMALNENLGFGLACNIGVAASNSSCLVCLNPGAVA